jgi:hypothetical protein
VCPQTFIDKTLIIVYTNIRPIYIKCKEGERGKLPERESERERERLSVAENGGSIGCKNGRWKNRPFWDKLGSRWKDYVIAGNYFNG